METIRKNSAAVIGYALTLVYFGLFTGRVNLLFYGEHAILASFETYAHSAEVGQFCLLFAVAFAATRNMRAVESLILPLSLVLLTLGYAATLYQAIADTPLFVSSTAAALFGAGQGSSFLGWMLVYARMKVSQVARCMVASTVLSGFLLLLLGVLPSTSLLFSLLSLIVAGNIVLLSLCLCEKHFVLKAEPSGEGSGDISTASAVAIVSALDATSELRDPEEHALSQANFRRQELKTWLFQERRAVLCLLSIAFACGVLRPILLDQYLQQMSAQVLFSVGYIVGALAFLAIVKLFGTNRVHCITYSVLLVVVATCGALASLQNPIIHLTVYAVDNIAFSVTSMCVIVTCLNAVRGPLPNPLFVVGTVCGLMYFAIQLGRIACIAVMHHMGTDTAGLLILSILVVYAVAIAAISSGLIKDPERTAPALSFSKEDAPDMLEKRAVIPFEKVSEEALRSNPLLKERFKLTDREIDVAVLLLAGFNAADSAQALSISTNTVKTHLKNLYAKMGVHSRRALINLLSEIALEKDQTA